MFCKVMLLFFGVLFSFSVSALPDPSIPKRYFDFWHTAGVLSRNNCYNYATNRVTNTFAQPGSSSGKSVYPLQCGNVYKAAAADLGLKETAYLEFSGKTGSTLIALVVAPGFDFHWYRRDDDGYWTHKPGGSYPLRTDDSGSLITDVESANRGVYKDFCGYFVIYNYLNEISYEQNSGYVRIGGMKALPEVNNPSAIPESKSHESYLEILVFSGRPNPRVPLKTVLQDEETKKLLATDRTKRVLKRANMNSGEGRLGYNGFLINDVEGLVFEKGTVMSIHKSPQYGNAFRKQIEKTILERISTLGYEDLLSQAGAFSR